MDGIANHFPAKNALDRRILHTYNLKIFPGLIVDTHGKVSLVLGPRHQFLFGSPAFQLFLFYGTTTRRRTVKLELFFVSLYFATPAISRK